VQADWCAHHRGKCREAARQCQLLVIELSETVMLPRSLGRQTEEVAEVCNSYLLDEIRCTEPNGHDVGRRARALENGVEQLTNGQYIGRALAGVRLPTLGRPEWDGAQILQANSFAVAVSGQRLRTLKDEP
jgi:hypothetical protein